MPGLPPRVVFHSPCISFPRARATILSDTADSNVLIHCNLMKVKGQWCTRTMSVLTTDIEPRSEAFQANRAAIEALVQDLRRQAERIRLGGSESAREKHLARGKLLVRDRVRALVDPRSPFLELSQLAAHGLYGE